MRGETVDEIAAAAGALRARALTVDAPADAIDTCGTGGDGLGHAEHFDGGGDRDGGVRREDRQARQSRAVVEERLGGRAGGAWA